MNKLYLIFLLISTTIFSLDFQKEIRGTGVERISYEGYGRVNIKKGSKNSIIIKSNFEESLDGFETDKSYKKMDIKYKGDKFINFDPVLIEIDITLEKLEFLEIEGGTITSIDSFDNKNLELIVKGASKVNGENINIKEVKISIGGASHINFEGKGKEVEVTISGAGNFLGKNYQVEDAKVELNGAGIITIKPSNKLEGRINGLGTVKYFGKPKDIDVDINGLGKLLED